VALIGAALLVAGCNDGSDDAPPAPAPALGSRLYDLATLQRHANRELRGEAQRVVDRLWRAVVAQDAALPLFYDDRVLDSLAPAERSAALPSPGPQLAVRPRVVMAEGSWQGLSVITVSRPGGGSRLWASYVLRKVGAEWKIVYDSNLVRSIDRLATTARQLRRPAADPALIAQTDPRLRSLDLVEGAEGGSRGLGPLLRRDYLRR
jgi:hypothetical protein